MKNNNFTLYLSNFFKIYLISDRNLSKATIKSYSDTFSQFLKFMKDEIGINISSIKISDYNRENILKFLRFLDEKGNSPSTINQRKAALASFCKYLKYEEPSIISDLDAILSIKTKKYVSKTISYMKAEGINLFLKQIDTSSLNGLRDFIMMCLMVLMGLRVSEVINIKIKDFHMVKPQTLIILGKGRKERMLSIVDRLVPYIDKYLESITRDKEDFAFLNHMNKQFTRFGLDYIVKKYGDMARNISSELIPSDLSCHKLRHSCGASMARAGVDVVYIRDILGHASITTTQRYIGAIENESKQEILNNLASDFIDEESQIDPIWKENIDVLDFLNRLKKSYT